MIVRIHLGKLSVTVVFILIFFPLDASAKNKSSLGNSSLSAALSSDDLVPDKLSDRLEDKKPSVAAPQFYYRYSFGAGHDSNPKLNDPAEDSRSLERQAVLGIKGNLGSAPFNYDMFVNHEALRYSQLPGWNQDNIRIKGTLSYSAMEYSYGVTPYVSVQSKIFYEDGFSPWFMRRDDFSFGIKKSLDFSPTNAKPSNSGKKLFNFEFDASATPRLERKKDGSSGLIESNNSIEYEASVSLAYFYSSDIKVILVNEIAYRVFQNKIDDDGSPFQKRSLKTATALLWSWNFLGDKASKEISPALSFGVKYERAVDNVNDGFFRWQVGPTVGVSGKF